MVANHGYGQKSKNKMGAAEMNYVKRIREGATFEILPLDELPLIYTR